MIKVFIKCKVLCRREFSKRTPHTCGIIVMDMSAGHCAVIVMDMTAGHCAVIVMGMTAGHCAVCDGHD